MHKPEGHHNSDKKGKNGQNPYKKTLPIATVAPNAEQHHYQNVYGTQMLGEQLFDFSRNCFTICPAGQFFGGHAHYLAHILGT